MPPRRANDSQVERLLHALKTDLSYRQDLARRIAARDNIKYDSAMRRLQRYITEGEQKRSFAAAPKQYQRELRQEVRATPPPRVALEPLPRFDLTPSEREESYDVTRNDLWAIYAYHDGDLDETVRNLDLTSRGARLYDLAISAIDQKVDVLTMRGGGELRDAVRDWLDEQPTVTLEEIQDFGDLFYDLPDWQIQMIIDDIGKGNTTFGDWLDAWYDDGMSLDAQGSEYWKLWRAAYKRAGKLGTA